MLHFHAFSNGSPRSHILLLFPQTERLTLRESRECVSCRTDAKEQGQDLNPGHCSRSLPPEARVAPCGGEARLLGGRTESDLRTHSVPFPPRRPWENLEDGATRREAEEEPRAGPP